MKYILLLFSCLFIFTACKNSGSGGTPPESSVQTIDTVFYNQLKQDNRGKVLVVNVFASWCPPCEAETPDFVRLYEEANGSFELVGLSIDEKLRDLDVFLAKHQVSYPVYRIKRDIQRILRAERVPTTVIYRPDGTVYRTVMGMIDGDRLAEMIARAGEAVTE